jgi:predicted small secreted protein
MLRKFAALLALAAIAAAATACNTIEGAGKDIKAAGGAIEKSASKTKGY